MAEERCPGLPARVIGTGSGRCLLETGPERDRANSWESTARW